MWREVRKEKGAFPVGYLLIAGVLAIVAVLLYVYLGSDSGGDMVSNQVEQPSEIPSTTAGIPVIDDIVEDMAISTIMEYDMVKDAAINQEAEDVSLVVILDYAASDEYARQIGDNFVRLVKSLSDDDPPSQVIGIGIYNYLIGVYNPSENLLALGAKSKNATDITWD